MSGEEDQLKVKRKPELHGADVSERGSSERGPTEHNPMERRESSEIRRASAPPDDEPNRGPESGVSPAKESREPLFDPRTLLHGDHASAGEGNRRASQDESIPLVRPSTRLLSTPRESEVPAPGALRDADSGHTEMYAHTAIGSGAPELKAPRAPTLVGMEAPEPQITASGGSGAPLTGKSETHIGPYEIIRKLGEGGMGVVYLARDNRLGRRVAIKVLRTMDRELTRRFIVEARTTARCTHENIVIIHDAGEHQGSPFMVLEYLEGKTLSDYQATDPPTIPHAVEIMVSVVRALVRAHEQGIVHRDLKPDNIFVTDSGTVKVLDFGIAKLLKGELNPALSLAEPRSGAALQGASASLVASMPQKTHATGIAGTAGYMSPEQWLTPTDVDHRSDIWAVGCTLFELLTGRNPLEELGSPAAVAQFMGADTPMPTVLSYGAKVPQELSKIIAQCLIKKREHRFADARTLLKALEPFLPGRRQALDGPVELGPFAGLRAFQEEDAARFFGRGKELGTLLSRLRDTPLMATVGPSGAGKSSFLRAGVIPALKNSGTAWEVLVVRPGRTPLMTLAEHLRPFLSSFAAERQGSILPSASDEQICERLIAEPGFLGAVLRNRCRSRQTRLLLFLDQFEELYTLGAETEERRALSAALLGAADDAASPVRVMLSIRADFVGRTTEDPDFVSTLSKGLFFLGPPSEQGLREALVRPAEMMGYRFETNAIVDQMISFLDGSPNGLPLLQFTAAQLWENRDPQNRQLTLSSYRGMGGVEGALVSHADRVYNQLAPAQQVLCRSVFMHLVTQERTRAIRTLRELEALSGDAAGLKRLVDQLVDSRLWVVTAEEGDATIEVVHESLITNWPSLRRWLDESHEDSVFVDQLLSAAQQWHQKQRDPGLLWRGELVAELAHFKRRFAGSLPPLASEFVDAIFLSEQKTAQRKRNMTVFGISALALLLCAATVGLYIVGQERNRAAKNAAIAERRLEEQLIAEQERLAAEQERERAEALQLQAEEKTVVLEDQVKLSAEELAEKNTALILALKHTREQQQEAVKAQKRAEQSEASAKEATRRAEESSERLKVMLEKERARAERLNAQIGTLVEEL